MPLEEKGKGWSRAGNREWRLGIYTATLGGVLYPIVYVNGAPWGSAVHRLGGGLPRPWQIGNGAGLWRRDEANNGNLALTRMEVSGVRAWVSSSAGPRAVTKTALEKREGAGFRVAEESRSQALRKNMNSVRALGWGQGLVPQTPLMPSEPWGGGVALGNTREVPVWVVKGGPGPALTLSSLLSLFLCVGVSLSLPSCPCHPPPRTLAPLGLHSPPSPRPPTPGCTPSCPRSSSRVQDGPLHT